MQMQLSNCENLTERRQIMEFYADRRQISLLVFLLVLLLCQVKNVIMPDADRRQMQVVLAILRHPP